MSKRIKSSIALFGIIALLVQGYVILEVLDILLTSATTYMI